MFDSYMTVTSFVSSPLFSPLCVLSLSFSEWVCLTAWHLWSLKCLRLPDKRRNAHQAVCHLLAPFPPLSSGRNPFKFHPLMRRDSSMNNTTQNRSAVTGKTSWSLFDPCWVYMLCNVMYTVFIVTLHFFSFHCLQVFCSNLFFQDVCSAFLE